MYQFIVGACKKNCEDLIKKKLELLVFKNKKLPSINFLYFFFYIIITGKLFKKNRQNIKYNNIEVIKFSLSSAYYNLDCYTKKLTFYKTLFKKILLSGSLINTCNYYLNKYNIEGIYIDHCAYTNGVIFSFFSQKKIPIYTNNNPYGIYFINYKKNKKKYIQKFENTLKIEFREKINNLQKFQAEKKILKILKNKNFIPWLSRTKFKKLKKINYKNFDYIIYPQAFSDAQIVYGNDGFENNLEWLEFTLNKFIHTKKKILIKPHPNYFNNEVSSFATYDQEIYYIISKKYKKYKNLFFLQEPIHNYTLLKRLNKRSVIVTQNSSVVMEASYMNFKSITSQNIFFDIKYTISNMWKNKEQYSKLLNTDYKKLRKPKKIDLLKIIYILFYIYNSNYNSSSWYHNIIIKYLKLTKNSFNYFFNIKARSKYSVSKLKVIKKIINKSNVDGLIKKISKNIYEIKN